MAFTFKGTYTKNRGDAVAAGTVDIVSKRGVTLDTATLDENGSYELVISAEEGEVTVVETLDGVEARSYPVSVSRGSTTDTSRDIGYVGPAAQSGASAPVVWVQLKVTTSAPSYGPATTVFPTEDPYTNNFFISGGPFTLGAGGTVELASPATSAIPAGAALALDDWSTELCVTNLAGTEKLAVACGDTPLEELGVEPIVMLEAHLDESIGTDLAVVDGRIVSTAGGQFMVQVSGQVTYTPAS